MLGVTDLLGNFRFICICSWLIIMLFWLFCVFCVWGGLFWLLLFFFLVLFYVVWKCVFVCSESSKTERTSITSSRLKIRQKQTNKNIDDDKEDEGCHPPPRPKNNKGNMFCCCC